MLIRDLQLRTEARSACVLAPLPARAAALAAFAARHRRAMLRLGAGGASAARARWASATRTLVPPRPPRGVPARVFAARAVTQRMYAHGSARRGTCTPASAPSVRSTAPACSPNPAPTCAQVLRWRGRQQHHAALSRRLATLNSAASAFSRRFAGARVAGPQLAASLHKRPAPPAAGGLLAPAPPAAVAVQVGQLLTTLRFAASNRLLPLTSQILDLLRRRNPYAGAAPPAPAPAPAAAADPAAAAPAPRPGVDVRVTAVGLDAVLLVEGRELVAFQMVDAALRAHLAPRAAPAHPDPAQALPGGAATTVGLQVDALSLLDLQARAGRAGRVGLGSQ